MALRRVQIIGSYLSPYVRKVLVFLDLKGVAYEINPIVWGEPTDDEVLGKTLRVDIPDVLDYLETQVPREGFLFRGVSIADISIASFFRNAAFARFQVDGARWPLTASFVERVLALDSFAKLKPFEERLMRTPIPRHRSVLAEMNAPVSSETYGTAVPRRGVMRI